MATLLQIQNPPHPGHSRFALWDLGFRPFYLLASSFAALSILIWALQFGGLLPYAYMRGPAWHAHEMLFGFTLAVLTGFLLTAGQNWSGQPTPKGGYLMALAALWVMGRLLVLSPWGWAAAVVNAAFPLAAGIALGVPLYRADAAGACSTCCAPECVGGFAHSGLGGHCVGTGCDAVCVVCHGWQSYPHVYQ